MLCKWRGGGGKLANLGFYNGILKVGGNGNYYKNGRPAGFLYTREGVH
jgi:hypothetical protein